MADYIDRQKLIKALEYDPIGRGLLDSYNLRGFLENIQSADISETIICGYPARHLAFIATVMQKEGVSPEEVASCLRDIGRMVGMIMAEQKEIIEKSWKEWGSV